MDAFTLRGLHKNTYIFSNIGISARVENRNRGFERKEEKKGVRTVNSDDEFSDLEHH